MTAVLQGAAMPGVRGVAAALGTLLPEGVGFAARHPDACNEPAYPEELATLARARPQRRREFIAGRAAARAALAQIGLPGRAIRQGGDRAPLWPEGAVGSIAHCTGCCLSAAAPARRARSIGVDVEPATALAPDLFGLICTPGELATLDRMSPAGRGLRAKLVFSTKESAFKALYPLVRTRFGFDAVEVRVDPATGRFAATILQPLARFRPGDRLAGRYTFAHGLIITALIVDA